MRKSLSSAPRVCNSACASPSAMGLGGVRKGKSSGGAPQRASSSASPVRSAVSISAGAKAGSVPFSPFAQSLYALPGPRRPARPARCVASAREARSVTRRDMPVPASKRARRANPLSTTVVMPSIVRDVSAIEVASTTLRRPSASGWIAARWSWNFIAPKSGRRVVSVAIRLASRLSVLRISPSPGRNARILPSVSFNACAMRSAICASRRRSFEVGRDKNIGSTG